jgi:hypothetical protein
MIFEKEGNNRFCERVRGTIRAAEKPGAKREIPPYLINTSDAYMGCQRWQMKPVVWTRKRD